MQAQDKLKRSDDVVSREVGGELVLLDLEGGQYFGLDQVGARVWELLGDEPQTIASLADDLAGEFDAPRERIEADLLDLATQMGAQGLVTRLEN
ncbi:PqqD family protein [Qipengyuania nanhaisediminis]|uniref:PqqD family protein n=1 Tax=Qipengyuania nanhaisediminis TaxID=604088 RepID=UPI0038B2A195